MPHIVHFILHVPKCAGTTVEKHFARHLGPGFLIAPRWNNVLRDVIGNRYPGLDLEGVRVVSGHSLSRSLANRLPGAEIRESVLLRDPIGYFLSLYNYRWTRFANGFGPKPPGFQAWYGRQPLNPISRFLMTRYFEHGVPMLYRFSSADRLAWLEERLARFHFVGGHLRADEMIAAVGREFGLSAEVEARNVTAEKRLRLEDVSDDMRDRMLTENALDAALFERWRDRGWSGRPTAPPPPLPRRDRLRCLLDDLRVKLPGRRPPPHRFDNPRNS